MAAIVITNFCLLDLCNHCETRNKLQIVYVFDMYITSKNGQVSLTATVTCNQYYLLSCGADGAR